MSGTPPSSASASAAIGASIPSAGSSGSFPFPVVFLPFQLSCNDCVSSHELGGIFVQDWAIWSRSDASISAAPLLEQLQNSSGLDHCPEMAFLENFLILKHQSGFTIKITAADALQATRVPKRKERMSHTRMLTHGHGHGHAHQHSQSQLQSQIQSQGQSHTPPQPQTPPLSNTHLHAHSHAHTHAHAHAQTDIMDIATRKRSHSGGGVAMANNSYGHNSNSTAGNSNSSSSSGGKRSGTGSGNYGVESQARTRSLSSSNANSNSSGSGSDSDKEKERDKDKSRDKSSLAEVCAIHADVSSFPVVLPLPKKLESAFAKAWKEKKVVQIAKDFQAAAAGAATAANAITPEAATDSTYGNANPTLTSATSTSTSSSTLPSLPSSTAIAAAAPVAALPPLAPVTTTALPTELHAKPELSLSHSHSHAHSNLPASASNAPSTAAASLSCVLSPGPSPPVSPPLTPTHTSAYSISELEPITDWTFSSTYMGSIHFDSNDTIHIPATNQLKEWAKVMHRAFKADNAAAAASLPIDTVRPSNTTVTASQQELDEENQTRHAIRQSFGVTCANAPFSNFTNVGCTAQTTLASAVASTMSSSPSASSSSSSSEKPSSPTSLFHQRRTFHCTTPSAGAVTGHTAGNSASGSGINGAVNLVKRVVTVDQDIVFMQFASDDVSTPRSDDSVNANASVKTDDVKTDKDKSPVSASSLDAATSLASAAANAANFLPHSLLRRRDPILFFTSFPLYEDELHDHGVSSFRVKLRVMPSCFLILLTFYLFLDNVCLRIYECRIFHLFGSSEVRREYCRKEMRIEDWKSLQMPSPLQRHFYQDVDAVNARLSALKNNPTLKAQTQEIIRFRS